MLSEGEFSNIELKAPQKLKCLKIEYQSIQQFRDEMKKSKFTERQIIKILGEQGQGIPNHIDCQPW